jgi:hypothetical protein
MFCFDPSNALHNAILELVAESPSLSVRELHRRIVEKKHHPVTIQHLYRTLHRLIDAQILVKDRARLTLNRVWLGQLGLFANQASLALERDEISTIALPLRSGQSVTIRTDSLRSLQAMWYHTLARLYAHQKKQPTEIAKYYSHAWWILDDLDDTQKFIRSVANLGISCSWLIGNTTPLDREAVERFAKVCSIRCAEKTPFPLEGYCVNVLGEYILESIFPKAAALQFKLLFADTKTDRHESIALLRELSLMKAPYMLKLWRNKDRAEEIAAKVKRYF